MHGICAFTVGFGCIAYRGKMHKGLASKCYQGGAVILKYSKRP